MVQVVVRRSPGGDGWTAALVVEGVPVVDVPGDTPEDARAALIERLRARLG